jgi:hypothetical protein
MKTDSDTVCNLLKAQAWELAKGQLLALVSMQGSYPSTDEAQSDVYIQLSDKVRAFIDDIEDHGYIG